MEYLDFTGLQLFKQNLDTVLGSKANNTEVVKIVTLNSAPTTSTKTYTIGTSTYSFKTGDEVRVADNSSDTGYVYYKLHNISNENAIWALIGGGSSSVFLTPTYDPITETLEFPEDMASYDSVTETITINL